MIQRAGGVVSRGARERVPVLLDGHHFEQALKAAGRGGVERAAIAQWSGGSRRGGWAGRFALPPLFVSDKILP